MLAKDRLDKLLELLGSEWKMRWEVDYNSYSLYKDNQYKGVLYFSRKTGEWVFQKHMKFFIWKDTYKPEALVAFIKGL